MSGVKKSGRWRATGQPQLERGPGQVRGPVERPLTVGSPWVCPKHEAAEQVGPVGPQQAGEDGGGQFLSCPSWLRVWTLCQTGGCEQGCQRARHSEKVFTVIP